MEPGRRGLSSFGRVIGPQPLDPAGEYAIASAVAGLLFFFVQQESDRTVDGRADDLPVIIGRLEEGVQEFAQVRVITAGAIKPSRPVALLDVQRLIEQMPEATLVHDRVPSG